MQAPQQLRLNFIFIFFETLSRIVHHFRKKTKNPQSRKYCLLLQQSSPESVSYHSLGFHRWSPVNAVDSGFWLLFFPSSLHCGWAQVPHTSSANGTSPGLSLAIKRDLRGDLEVIRDNVVVSCKLGRELELALQLKYASGSELAKLMNFKGRFSSSTLWESGLYSLG